ncbi:MAG: hypothetical protein IPP44_00595 [Ideonella sp.]|nr:hypothetical protein [Ideonella sp.]
MPSTVVTSLLCAVALLVLVGWLLKSRYGGYPPEPYRSRACQGGAWKKAFPTAASTEVRNYLLLFVKCFGFHDTQRLQFGPQDQIFQIYEALYPTNGGIDGLELETLAVKIERQYKVDFCAIWHQGLTFGELFFICQAALPRDTQRDA